MKIGFKSNIFVNRDNMQAKVEVYKKQIIESDYQYFILVGNIADTYEEVLEFVERLEESVQGYTTAKVRFVASNSDFYYTEQTVYKAKKFREILKLLYESPHYLVSNPVILPSVQIIGLDTWYDYSLFRGKPTSLKNITKKKFLGLFPVNSDNKYITDETDYVRGLDNTFDVCYTKETLEKLGRTLQRLDTAYENPTQRILVGYFYPNKLFLSNGFYSKYEGTFSGSSAYSKLIENNYKVDTWIVGKHSEQRDFYFNKIHYLSASNSIITLDVEEETLNSKKEGK